MDVPIFLYAGYHSTGNVSWHLHQGTELILLVKGRCRIETADAACELHSGDALLIPPDTKHNQIDMEETNNYYCVFQSSAPALTDGVRKITGANDEKNVLLLNELFKMTLENDYTGSEGILYALLCRLAAADTPRPDYPEALCRILSYLRSHYRTNQSIEEIAMKNGLSAWSLRLLFRKHLKQTPGEYRNRLRLTLSRKLLSDSQLRIKEIADYCGYQDVNYFIRLYRKHFGSTPGSGR